MRKTGKSAPPPGWLFKFHAGQIFVLRFGSDSIPFPQPYLYWLPALGKSRIWVHAGWLRALWEILTGAPYDFRGYILLLTTNRSLPRTRVHRSTAHTPQPPSTKIQKFLKLSSKGTPKKYRVRSIFNMILNDILEVVKVKRWLKCVLKRKFRQGKILVFLA
jgi:hypothetical protein